MNDYFKDITYVPLDVLATPVDGKRVLLDRYFVVHPDKGALIWKRYTPQCNVHPSLPQRLADGLYPGCVVEFVPVAYVDEDPWVAS